MSLRAFHIVFITLSALLTFGLAVYAFLEVTGPTRFVWILLAIAGGVLLTVYGMRFVRKMKELRFE